MAIQETVQAPWRWNSLPGERTMNLLPPVGLEPGRGAGSAPGRCTPGGGRAGAVSRCDGPIASRLKILARV